MAEPRKVIFEVIEVGNNLISGYIREPGGKVYGIVPPRFMCPEVACIPGGAFYVLTEGVDPIEDQKELDKIFKDI